MSSVTLLSLYRCLYEIPRNKIARLMLDLRIRYGMPFPILGYSFRSHSLLLRRALKWYN
jgi:hypothetical protein